MNLINKLRNKSKTKKKKRTSNGDGGPVGCVELSTARVSNVARVGHLGIKIIYLLVAPKLCSVKNRETTITATAFTGTCQEVAEYVANLAGRRGFAAASVSLDSIPVSQAMESSLAVFVVSTTGDGEVPNNMSKFWRFLRRRCGLLVSWSVLVLFSYCWCCLSGFLS